MATSTGKVRIFELAKEVGLTSKELIALFNDRLGGVFEAKNQLSVVPDQIADLVRSVLKPAGAGKSAPKAEAAPKAAPKKKAAAADANRRSYAAQRAALTRAARECTTTPRASRTRDQGCESDRESATARHA